LHSSIPSPNQSQTGASNSSNLSQTRKYAAIGEIWRRQWEQIIPFFAFAPAVRKIIYTTNAIEALNAKLRRAVRARGHFPSDEAATKLIFLVLRQVTQEWKNAASRMGRGENPVRLMFGDRFVRT
jgi:putative transposase